MHSKRKFFTLTVLIIILLLFGAAFILYSSLYKPDYLNSSFTKRSERPIYHFAVIAPSSYDTFWDDVRKGAIKAANDLNVAVEFNSPRFTNLEEELRFLNIAIASNVDGIATHVLDEASFTPVINKAVDSNIPVVTVESDAKNSKRSAYIGSNNYQVGSVGGKMIAEATSGKAKVAIILNGYNPGMGDVSQNLRVTGFRDAVKNYNIDIEAVRISGMGIFSAGEITNELIAKDPQINAIFCTNPRDTLGATQMVVDLNKVGKITIVGYGNHEELMRYIEKGVVYGSVASNPADMGYKCIKALYEIRKTKRTSVYEDTDVYAVTKENLNSIRKSTKID
ncbi:MAG TPA: substrate-binding domain-containing protein [Ruminiclostridium sp.]|nr:substrate-binding domain-containing protein [Ruminiclostridium sp.]